MYRYLNRFNSTIVRELNLPRNTKISPPLLVFIPPSENACPFVQGKIFHRAGTFWEHIP
jgi:hypothetical protein